MSVGSLRVVASTLGLGAMLGAALLSGGWWWLAAGVGAVAAVGAAADRHLGHPQVLACLATSVGLAVEGHEWFVPLLVAGTIGSIELAAAADRTSIVRPQVPGLRSAVVAGVGSAILAAMVLLAGHLPLAVVSGSVVVAAAAGVVATRVIAR